MTRDEVIQLLAFFAEAYPSTPPTANPELRVEIWHQALGDFPADRMVAAARLIVKADKFHPSLARCISVAVNATTLDGVITRVRVARYLEEGGGMAAWPEEEMGA